MAGKVRPAIVILCLLLALSAGIASAQDGDVLRIGLLTDQSGPLTVYGIEQQNGFMLGLEYATGGTMEVAGRPIEVIVRDNASNPDTAASQARELVENEGVEILVGTVSSGATLQLQPIALDYDVILMAGPAALPDITGAAFNVNTFRVCRNSFQDFLAFGPYAAANVGTNLVQLAADYAFGVGSAAAAQLVLEPLGFSFVQDTILAPLETTDFTPYLQQVLDSGADAVIIHWAGDTTVTLFQQIQELGVGEQIAVVGAFNSNDIMALSDPSTIGTISWMIYHYTFPDNEINDWLVEQHIEQFDDVPDLFTECTFATAQALVAALEATGGDALPAALIPELEGLTFEGPKGTYYIRVADHQALVPMYVARLVNLDDPEFRFYELLETIPADQIVPPCLAGEERCAMEEEMIPAPEATPDS